MTPFPENVSDSELLAFVERWVALLDREDYEAASALPDHHSPQHIMTPDAIRDAVRLHGQRVTLEGGTDDTGPPMTRRVERWPLRYDGSCGEIWYDLYIDGHYTDMTALFYLRPTDGGITVHLIDIGVR
jgi:hypothetical protein